MSREEWGLAERLAENGREDSPWAIGNRQTQLGELRSLWAG